MTSRKLLILYGSQTGTAQDISERIWREAKRYFAKMTLFTCSDIRWKSHALRLVFTGTTFQDQSKQWMIILLVSCSTRNL